jgi:glycopeptide antibiotics resistance protein
VQTRRLSLSALAAAVALIALVLVPWADVQNHSHWANVRWVPFVTPPVRARDILGNLLLFAPLGVVLARSGLRIVWIGAVCAGLSVAGEWTQLYSHSRFPSAQDVVCNLAGGLLAAWIVRGLPPVARRPPVVHFR